MSPPRKALPTHVLYTSGLSSSPSSTTTFPWQPKPKLLMIPVLLTVFTISNTHSSLYNAALDCYRSFNVFPVPYTFIFLLHHSSCLLLLQDSGLSEGATVSQTS